MRTIVGVVKCYKCGGAGKVVGQSINNRRIVNHNNIQNGICFNCAGKGKLDLTSDNKIIRMTNTTDYIEYDNKGTNIGYGKLINTISVTNINIKDEVNEFLSRYSELWFNHNGI